MHRFYCADSLDGEEIELSDEEANHLTRVLRLTSGDQVELFDGRGSSVVAEVIRAKNRSVLLRGISSPAASRQLVPRITLLTAAPKSDRLRFLVEKATELGVHRLRLIETRHSVVHPGTTRVEKLTAAVVAACKQCGRNDLMSIDPPRPWQQVLEAVGTNADKLFMAVPGAPPLREALSDTLRMASLECQFTVAVGPEGGWTQAEVDVAVEHGAVLVGLGEHILRIETAAIAAVSVIRLGVFKEA